MKIKQLDWNTSDKKEYIVHYTSSIIHHYYEIREINQWFTLYILPEFTPGAGALVYLDAYDTLAKAKNSAQIDLEQSILNWIET